MNATMAQTPEPHPPRGRRPWPYKPAATFTPACFTPACSVSLAARVTIAWSSATWSWTTNLCGSSASAASARATTTSIAASSRRRAAAAAACTKTAAGSGRGVSALKPTRPTTARPTRQPRHKCYGRCPSAPAGAIGARPVNRNAAAGKTAEALHSGRWMLFSGRGVLFSGRWVLFSAGGVGTDLGVADGPFSSGESLQSSEGARTLRRLGGDLPLRTEFSPGRWLDRKTRPHLHRHQALVKRTELRPRIGGFPREQAEHARPAIGPRVVGGPELRSAREHLLPAPPPRGVERVQLGLRHLQRLARVPLERNRERQLVLGSRQRRGELIAPRTLGLGLAAHLVQAAREVLFIRTQSALAHDGEQRDQQRRCPCGTGRPVCQLAGLPGQRLQRGGEAAGGNGDCVLPRGGGGRQAISHHIQCFGGVQQDLHLPDEPFRRNADGGVAGSRVRQEECRLGSELRSEPGRSQFEPRCRRCQRCPERKCDGRRHGGTLPSAAKIQ
eukprot:scaffold1625_cov104-Isochrysis_galbana.AAC.3